MQAVLFDLDGVVIDSHNQHELAWERLAIAHNRELPSNFFKESFGMRNQTIFPTLLKWSNHPDEIEALSEEKERYYREILLETGLQALPGAADLLAELAQTGIPAVLATSTPRSNVAAVMQATGLGGYFHGIVSGSDVREGKPAPEVFLKAAALAGFPTGECLVIEDAHVGIRAALAAGCKVLAVTTTHPKESLAAEQPTFIRESLVGVSVKTLKDLWANAE